MFKHLLYSSFIWLLGLSLALAQSPPIPQAIQQGFNYGNLRQNTYTAIAVGLVPPASATDILCISAGTSKNVAVTHIAISGTAGTAVTTPFVLLRRNTAVDSGGTAATGLALPVASGTLYANPTSNATLIAYTANPTINDSSPSYLRASVLGIPQSSAALAQILDMNFSTNIEEYDQYPTLVKASTQQLCINLNGTSISSGSLTIWLEWQEF